MDETVERRLAAIEAKAERIEAKLMKLAALLAGEAGRPSPPGR